MTRVISIVGLVASLAMLFAAYTAAPEAANVEGTIPDTFTEGCVIRNVALDEGYGVTRTEKRIICAKDQ
jgi:hypothetical protein